jgi:hypothetical protein
MSSVRGWVRGGAGGARRAEDDPRCPEKQTLRMESATFRGRDLPSLRPQGDNDEVSNFRRLTLPTALVLAAVGGWTASSASAPDEATMHWGVPLAECDPAAIAVLERAAHSQIHSINHCPSLAEAEQTASRLSAMRGAR